MLIHLQGEYFRLAIGVHHDGHLEATQSALFAHCIILSFLALHPFCPPSPSRWSIYGLISPGVPENSLPAVNLLTHHIQLHEISNFLRHGVRTLPLPAPPPPPPRLFVLSLCGLRQCFHPRGALPAPVGGELRRREITPRTVRTPVQGVPLEPKPPPPPRLKAP